MNKKSELKLNTNKGFTLVELVVVLVLMSILLGITIFSVVGWIDWARFKHEEAAAEDIFYAAQNQLTELDSSGALKKVMLEYLWDNKADSDYYEHESDLDYIKGNYHSDYILAQGKKEDLQVGGELFSPATGIQNSDGTYYEWQKLWKDKNLDSQKRTIIKLVVDADRYKVYVAKTTPTGIPALSNGEKLLFNLIAPYISDKSVLNGAIAIEFSPEAAQVFSVCYSDQKRSLTYADTPASGAVSIKDRRLQTRESSMLGYFGVDTLTSKIRGRSRSTNAYRLEIINDDVLYLKLGSTSGNAEVLKNSTLTYRIYGALKYNNGGDPYSEVMNFTFDMDDVNNVLQGEKGFDKRTEINAQVEFSQGQYVGKTYSFRFPVWLDNTGGFCVALDAADIQAQSIIYAESLGFIEETNSEKEDAQKRFINTYSFYRFGLPSVRFIRAEADVSKQDGGATVTGTAKSGIVNEEDKFVEHSNEGDAPRGSAVTFADPEEADITKEDDDTAPTENFIYGIKNGRHLYNVRFETDYGDDLDKYLKDNSFVSKDIKKSFVLRADVDWDVFTGIAAKTEGSEDSNGSGESNDSKMNYLLNSYITGSYTPGQTGDEYNGCPKAGINVFAGVNSETGIDRYELSYVKNNDTADYPFPGFRMLSYGDTFSQKQDITDLNKGDGNNAKYFKVSNIDISLAANYIYGVYGKSLQEEIDNINKDRNDSSKKYDFSSLNKYGEAGAIPLGLFAQNNGTINNIELDNIVVNGVEGYPASDIKNGQFVYTSKVGAVAGENFGTVENIYIDEYKRYDGADQDYISSIKGYSDVGGIVGHQSYIYVASGNTDPQNGKIQKCINNAKVTGATYVGGIIGRIYPAAVTGLTGIDLYDSKYSVDSTEKNFSDHYIVPSSKIETNSYDYSKVNPGSFTIDHCKNRGEVSLDPLFVKYVVGDNTLHRGFYFGGITGAAFNNVNPDNNSSFTGYTHGAANTKKVVISNCDSCQTYKIDGDGGLKMIMNPLSTNAEQMLEATRRLRATFVGGIVGGIRYGYIINCSTTPDANDKKLDAKTSFVFGDRYVGGVAGFSYEADYSYDEACLAKEIAKVENGSDIAATTNHIYNMINGTGAYGNYAIGGIAGCFGTPETSGANDSYVQDELEYGLSDENKYDYPVNGDFTGESVVNGLLNTSVVLGSSFKSTVNSIADPSEDTSVGMYFYGVGGIAGVLATRLQNCDFVQSESEKNLAVTLICLNTNENYSNISGLDTLFSDAISPAVSNLKDMINTSQFATDGVGGIAGHIIEGGHINAKKSGIRFDSYVDAVVFGRNRVGGAVGDAVAHSDGKSRMANIIPTRAAEGSSGMYVIGYENVGGLIGAHSDNGGGESGLNTFSLDYNDKALNSMYHVMGYRAVGGMIGTFYKYKGTGVRKPICGNINTNSENNKTCIRGSMYVGGIVGIQEMFDDSLNSTGKYSANKRYRVGLKFAKIDAECFAGNIAGAMFGSDKKYCPADILMESSKDSLGHRTFVTTEIAGSFMTGIYGYNNYPGYMIYNGNKEMSVLVNMGDNSNYKVCKDESGNLNSCNGLYNLSPIRDFEYDSDNTLLKTKIQIKETFDDYQNFDSESDRPVQAIKDYMEMAALSQTTQAGGDSHCFVVSKIYAGGFAGYIPKNTYISIQDYKNRAVLRTYGAIKSEEAGTGDTTDYSYLGAVCGKIPVGMKVKNSWNTSEEQTDKAELDITTNPTGQEGFYNSKLATYKGGVTEVNAGIIVDNVTNASSQGSLAPFNKLVNSNIGKGAIAGVNGTSETNGTNSGVIRNCNNSGFAIVGNVIGGIAAVAGGSSTIEGCTNSMSFNAAKVDEVEGYAGGILGGVLGCVPDGKIITLKDNLNTGGIGESSGNHSAGIVYDSSELTDIILCRNYSSVPKYAITSTEDGKTANSIKYSWDASGVGNANNNLTNKAFKTETSTRNTIFGDVKDRGGNQSKMYANFFVGNKPEGSVIPTFVPAQVSEFAVNKCYIGNIGAQGGGQIISYEKADGTDVRADDNVLSADSGNVASWATSDGSDKLAFEILPVKKIDGTNSGYNKYVYSNIDTFTINWIHESLKCYFEIKDINLDDTTNPYYSDYARFSDNGGVEGSSLLERADAEYTSNASIPAGYQDGGLSAYIPADMKTKYFFSIYLYMKQNGIGVDETGEVLENEFISNLYSNAKYVSEHQSDFGNVIKYRIVLYDADGHYLSSNEINKSIDNTVDSEIYISNFSKFDGNGRELANVSDFTNDGTVKLKKDESKTFDPDQINKILVVIDSVTPGENASINSFKWIEGGDNPATVSTIMPSVGSDVTILDEGEGIDVDPSDLIIVDPDVATFDMQDILTYIKDHNVPLAKLFKDTDYTPEDELYLYKSNDYLTDIIWTGYGANCDNQYKAFITGSYIYNIDFPDD